MEEERDLPANVIEALKRGQKIEAVKLLREAEGLDLKAAKERVDRHAANHPGAGPPRLGSLFTRRSVPGGLRGKAAAVIAAIAYYVTR